MDKEIKRRRRKQARKLLRDSCCARCGGTENLTIDHIKALSAGGTDAWSNLQALCATCNLFKDRNPPDFTPQPWGYLTGPERVPITVWDDRQIRNLADKLIRRLAQSNSYAEKYQLQSRVNNLIGELVKRHKPEWIGPVA